MEHERTSDFWQDKHRALENAVYNSEHDLVSCVQCGCKIIAPLLADSPRCKDCREGTMQASYELDRLRALLRLIAVDSGCHGGTLSDDVQKLLERETGIEPLFERAKKGVVE